MPENYTCVKCGKVAKTKQALERHAAYHEDDRPFSCEVCLQRFKNSDDRGKHYRRLKRDGKFLLACQVCHKHFKTQELLSKHLEILGCLLKQDQPGENSFANLDSGQQSENVGSEQPGTSTNNVNPALVLNNNVKCTCKICESEFIGTDVLKKHYRDAHSDNKRQVCIQCGQTLSSKDSLARHYSIFHQNNYPFQCDFCEQKFKIKESLCRHIKFVHKDGGYPCDICQRVFSQPVNLKKHMAMHSSSKEFTCTICGRDFRWKQALQKHQLLHESQSDQMGLKAKHEISGLSEPIGISGLSEPIDSTNMPALPNNACAMGRKLGMTSNLNLSENKSSFDFSDAMCHGSKMIPGNGQFYQTCSNRFMSTIKEDFHCEDNFKSSSQEGYHGFKPSTSIDVAGSRDMRVYDRTAEESCALPWQEHPNKITNRGLNDQSLMGNMRYGYGNLLTKHGAELNVNNTMGYSSKMQESEFEISRVSRSQSMGDGNCYPAFSESGDTGNSTLKDLANIITSYAHKNAESGPSYRLSEHLGVDLTQQRVCDIRRTCQNSMETGSNGGETRYLHSGGDISSVNTSASRPRCDSSTFSENFGKPVSCKRRYTHDSVFDNLEIENVIKRSRTCDASLDGVDMVYNNIEDSFLNVDSDRNVEVDGFGGKHKSTSGQGNVCSRGKNLEHYGIPNNSNAENSDKRINDDNIGVGKIDEHDNDYRSDENVHENDDHEYFDENETEQNGEGISSKRIDKALTSRPTKKEKNAQKLLFRPSSIQKLFNNGTQEGSGMDSEGVSDHSEEDAGIPSTSAGDMPLTANQGVNVENMTNRRSNNPFLIVHFSSRKTREFPEANDGAEPIGHNKGEDKDDRNIANKENKKHAQEIHGTNKFSLVKHMLSLKNEENFDKDIFKNPLYSSTADVRGLENLINRHKVEDEDGCYDLSAKQSIPFQWLGARVVRLPIEKDEDNKPIDSEDSLLGREETLEMEETFGKEIDDDDKSDKDDYDDANNDDDFTDDNDSDKKLNIGERDKEENEQVIQNKSREDLEAMKQKTIEIAEKVNSKFQDCGSLSNFKIMREMVKCSKYSSSSTIDDIKTMNLLALKNPFDARIGNKLINELNVNVSNYEGRSEGDTPDIDPASRNERSRSFSSHHSSFRKSTNSEYSKQWSEAEENSGVNIKESSNRRLSADSHLQVPSQWVSGIRDQRWDNRTLEPEPGQNPSWHKVDAEKSRLGSVDCGNKERLSSENRHERVKFGLADDFENKDDSSMNNGSTGSSKETTSWKTLNRDQNALLMLFNKNLSQLDRLKVVPDVIQSSKDRLLSGQKFLQGHRTKFNRNTSSLASEILSENIAEELTDVLCSTLENEPMPLGLLKTVENVETEVSDKGGNDCGNVNIDNTQNSLVSNEKVIPRSRSYSGDWKHSKFRHFKSFGKEGAARNNSDCKSTRNPSVQISSNENNVVLSKRKDIEIVGSGLEINSPSPDSPREMKTMESCQNNRHFKPKSGKVFAMWQLRKGSIEEVDALISDNDDDKKSSGKYFGNCLTKSVDSDKSSRRQIRGDKGVPSSGKDVSSSSQCVSMCDKNSGHFNGKEFDTFEKGTRGDGNESVDITRRNNGKRTIGGKGKGKVLSDDDDGDDSGRDVSNEDDASSGINICGAKKSRTVSIGKGKFFSDESESNVDSNDDIDDEDTDAGWAEYGGRCSGKHEEVMKSGSPSDQAQRGKKDTRAFQAWNDSGLESCCRETSHSDNNGTGKAIRQPNYYDSSSIGKNMREPFSRNMTSGKGHQDSNFRNLSSSGEGFREDNYENLTGGNSLRENNSASSRDGKRLRANFPENRTSGKAIEQGNPGNSGGTAGERGDRGSSSDDKGMSIYELLSDSGSKEREYESLDKLLYTYF